MKCWSIWYLAQSTIGAHLSAVLAVAASRTTAVHIASRCCFTTSFTFQCSQSSERVPCDSDGLGLDMTKIMWLSLIAPVFLTFANGACNKCSRGEKDSSKHREVQYFVL